MNEKSSADSERGEPLVLLVDDDESASQMAEIYLKRAGYRVRHSAEGEDALAASAKEKPAAVLLDLYLPDTDGFAVCRSLKSSEGTKDVPVIVLSSHGNREHVLRAIEVGASDFIVKPVDPHLLLHKVHTNLPESSKQPISEPTERDPGSQDERRYVRIGEISKAVLHLPLETVDLSEGGVGLMSKSPVFPGNVLFLSCQKFVSILGVAEVPVRVKYARQVGGRPRYRLGVEFVDMDEKNRKKIRQYIYKRQVAKVRTP
jgi:DNA-binding response OmpR family regulator